MHLEIATAVQKDRFTWDVDVDAVNEPSQTWDVLDGKLSLSFRARVLGTLLVSPCTHK